MMAKRGRKRTKKRYFTKIQDMAIVAYNNLPEGSPKRDRIFNRFIYQPMDKLIEVTINHLTNHDYINLSYEDLHHAVFSHILEKLPMFITSQGNAYSYFTIVARNWIIQENDRCYKKLNIHSDLDSVDLDRDVTNEVHYENYQEQLAVFMDMFIEYWENNMTLHFEKRRELAIVDSLMYFFKKRENIEDYNKKALYILLRERTGVKTVYITSVVNKMKKMNKLMYSNFVQTGKLLLTDNCNDNIFI